MHQFYREGVQEVEMDITYKLKYFATRTLLTFLGPADLDENNDPRVLLKREYAERYPKKARAGVDGADSQAPVASLASTGVAAAQTR